MKHLAQASKKMQKLVIFGPVTMEILSWLALSHDLNEPEVLVREAVKSYINQNWDWHEQRAKNGGQFDVP